MSPRVTLGAEKSHLPRQTVSTEQPLPSTSLLVPLHALAKSSGCRWDHSGDHSGDTFLSMSHCLRSLCHPPKTGGCLSLMPGHRPAPAGHGPVCWGGRGACCDFWGATEPLPERLVCGTACAATGFLYFQLSNLLDWSWEVQEIRSWRR